MSQVRHTQSLNTILRLMANAIEADRKGTPIRIFQVETFHAALGTIAEDLQRRELAVIEGESRAADIVGRDVVDALYAERLVEGATGCVKRLVSLAMDAATKAELAEIDVAACAILDAMEALSQGVARPANIFTNTPSNDIGA